MTDLPNLTIQMPNPPAPRRGAYTARTRRDETADVSRLIGRNLREARKQSGYSLETLSKKSGVSRAMLGQIETAKSVPTITLVWRIADALGITIGALIYNPKPEPVAVIRAVDRSNLTDAIRPLWPTAHDGEPRFFEVCLKPRASSPLAARPLPLRASLVVAKGRMRVELDSLPPIELDEGDAANFDAQQAALLVNRGDDIAIAWVALHSKRAD